MEVPAKTLGELASLLRTQGERALRSRYPAPALLVAPLAAAPARVATPATGEPRRSETTVPLGSTASNWAESRETQRAQRSSGAASLFDPRQLVVRLMKSDRNPFSGVITVGRAKSNDVVIDSPEVSKVHAWVLPRGEGFALKDNSSTNGTFLNSVRLSSVDEVALTLGSSVRFGPIHCRLVTADDLVEYCAGVKERVAET